MKYLIFADEPFPGYIQSIVGTNGIVAYSGGMTVEEYERDCGRKLRVLSEDELDTLIRQHEESLITAPTPETDEQWNDALGVLPPVRWHRHNGVELFHISEHLTGDIVSWHGKLRGKSYSFNDRCNAPSEYLADKVQTAQAALENI